MRPLGALLGFMVVVACGGTESTSQRLSSGGAGGTSGSGGSGTGGSSGAGATGSTGGSGATAGSAGAAGAGAGTPFNQVHLAATHNSYSGHERGTIRAQLDGGVRFIEYDVHDNDFPNQGYRVGHDAPGDEVDHLGDNPATDKLEDWLNVLASWSAANPSHTPIVVGLDLKDSLEDNPTIASGNLTAFNRLLETLFPKLLPAANIDKVWPHVEQLAGRSLFVLSGDEQTRLGYRRDRGQNPAVAINSHGQIVEVHDSGSGQLWYWAGKVEVSQGVPAVRWLVHERYDTGDRPAVALNDAGQIVEVHEDPGLLDDQLWYRVGTLQADYRIAWTSTGGQPFPNNDSGVTPSVRFTNLSASTVREVHKSQTSSQHWYWNGSISGGAVSWTRNAADGGKTSDPLFNKSSDSAGSTSVQVSTGPSGPHGADTLLYSLNGAAAARIRYEQVLFVETQYFGSAALAGDGLWFAAANAASGLGRSWATAQRAQGLLVRLWGFNQAYSLDPPVNYAATDHPTAPWYLQYCQNVGCLSP